MICLITGGSGCGKSTWAEKLVRSLPAGDRVYIATMQVYDRESEIRVQRHRAQRAGLGFRTVECEKDLAAVQVEAGSVVLLGLSPEEVTGRGAGLSDAGLRRKIAAIRQAIAVNRPDAGDPVDVLAKLGGFELAGMAGAFLGGLKYHIPVIPDGMIPAASALIAARIDPDVVRVILPGPVSREPADRRILDSLGLEPVIHAQTALGEGTGGILLLPLLDMALKVYNGPHTFDALKMEAYTPQEEMP